MKKYIVISDPFPRTLDLIFSKKKLKELKSKYKLITAPKLNKKDFYEKNIHKATFIMGQPDLDKNLLSKASKLIFSGFKSLIIDDRFLYFPSLSNTTGISLPFFPILKNFIFYLFFQSHYIKSYDLYCHAHLLPDFYTFL